MRETDEDIRQIAVEVINSQVESNSKDDERKRLEDAYGKVWDTKELQEDFTVIGFMAPFITATRKSDGASGVMMFQHRPRFYFSFNEI